MVHHAAVVLYIVFEHHVTVVTWRLDTMLQ